MSADKQDLIQVQPQQRLNASINFRMRTAMVLFELEQALGRYVAEVATSTDDVPEKMRQEVLSRKHGPQAAVAPKGTGLGHLIQETYIGELLDIAIKAAQHRTDNVHLEQLKALVENLGVFDIRNAVCHPNRPFHESFWHRIAAIATDPAIEALQMKSVIYAYRAAEEDRITPPPEDWLTQPAWAVANNLPAFFDHEITGLIGRQKEAQQLKRYLQNSRFALIAVTGPGGCGKTALCLETLRDCCLEPSSLEWTDEAVYVTAKTEQLTTIGIEIITDPVSSLDHVKREIVATLRLRNDLDEAATFGDAISSLSARRILICLDNLETLLRDHGEAFDDLVATLPPTWRILVTSRVTVNSATVLPIGVMTDQGATRLARDYVVKRGGERLAEQSLTDLVVACDRNPLAIRLTIDAFLAGTELALALNQTRNNILDFSYTSLLDALPRPAISILECLFSLPDPQERSEIASLLDMSMDDVANALTSLLRTSLITRHTDHEFEKYSLSSSVRDLLLRLPQNPDVRNAVHEKLREQRMLVGQIQQSRDASTSDPCAWNFVPDDASQHAKALALKSFRAIRMKAAREQLIELLEQIRAAVQRERCGPMLFRVMAYLLLELHDRYGAIDALRKACQPTAWDCAAALKLAELLRDDQNHEESLRYSSALVEKGFGEPKRCSFESAARVLRARWVVAIWQDKYEEAREAASDWRNGGDLRATLGCIYFTAVKRSLERERDTKKVEYGIKECLACISALFESDGHLSFIVHAAFNALDDMVRATRLHALSPATVVLIAQFCDRHLHAMCVTDRSRSLDDENVRETINILRTLDCGSIANPLLASRWDGEALGDDSGMLGSYGYIKVRVYHRPQTVPCSFLFGKDSEGNEYYIHRKATGLSQRQFDELRVGDAMSVRPDDKQVSAGKAIPVRDAVPW